MENIAVWLDRVQQTCQQIGQNYIDIIIDQCGLDFSVIPALSGFSPVIKWSSLYEGLPEDIYREDAPVLARIDLREEQQVRWLYDLAEEVSDTAPLMVLGSPWPLSFLAGWLRQCTDASHEGRAGIFRFWDTRNFPWLFSDVLNETQQNQLYKPALFWSWMNRDGDPEILTGDGNHPTDDQSARQISFGDSQFEALMCLCDARQFIKYQLVPENHFASREEEFSLCFQAMLAATKAGILLDQQRDNWVINHLNG